MMNGIERFTDENGCYAIREYKCKELVRANPQVWKLAEWLYWNVFDLLYPGTERFCVCWEKEEQPVKNQMYDKAKQLTYMFAYNAFTGPDNHEE